MRRMTRLMTLLMAVAMLLTLTACGGSAEAPAADAPAADAPAAEAPAADAVVTGVEDGVLTVGMECAYAPYNWTQMDDSNGAVPIANNPGTYANGYDVMIAKKICEANGWELEVMQLDWDSLVPAVQNGTVDAVIAGQSMTADRMAEVDMAGPYYYATIVTLVKADSEYANATSIADLAGKKVAVGSAGSGTEVMARTLLGLYGMTYDDIEEDFLGFGDASTGLKDKTLDAAIIWAGAPTSGLLELGAQNDFYMIDIPADKMAELKASQPFCVEATMDSSIYSGMKNTATTIGVPATICAREDLSEQLVYDFLVATFDNLQTVAESHTQGANLSLETCLMGLESAELHPGAVKFYTEKGLL